MGRGEADNNVSGRSHGRHRAILMSASGQSRGRLRAVSRGRRHRPYARALGGIPAPTGSVRWNRQIARTVSMSVVVCLVRWCQGSHIDCAVSSRPGLTCLQVADIGSLLPCCNRAEVECHARGGRRLADLGSAPPPLARWAA